MWILFHFSVCKSVSFLMGPLDSMVQMYHHFSIYFSMNGLSNCFQFFTLPSNIAKKKKPLFTIFVYLTNNSRWHIPGTGISG